MEDVKCVNHDLVNEVRQYATIRSVFDHYVAYLHIDNSSTMLAAFKPAHSNGVDCYGDRIQFLRKPSFSSILVGKAR